MLNINLRAFDLFRYWICTYRYLVFALFSTDYVLYNSILFFLSFTIPAFHLTCTSVRFSICSFKTKLHFFKTQVPWGKFLINLRQSLLILTNSLNLFVFCLPNRHLSLNYTHIFVFLWILFPKSSTFVAKSHKLEANPRRPFVF
jgi:hypothetical protein